MNAHALPEAPVTVTCRLSMRSIIELASQFFGVSMVEILSQRREGRIVEARNTAIYAIRELLPRSYPEIGRALGGRDHTTVMHACRSITQDILLDEGKRARVEAFLNVCRVATPLGQPDTDPFAVARTIMRHPGLATNVSIETIKNFAAIVSAAIVEASRQDEEVEKLEAFRASFEAIQPEMLAFIRAFHGFEAATDRGQDHARRSFEKHAAALVATFEKHFHIQRKFK